MKQIFSQEVTAKKFDFLNLPKKTYEKSRFLRNIRQNYLMYKFTLLLLCLIHLLFEELSSQESKRIQDLIKNY